MKSTSVIPLINLSEMIEPLLYCYYESRDSNGDLLLDLIQEDWDVFSDQFIEILGYEKKYFIENLIHLQLSPRDAAMSPDFSGYFLRHDNDLKNDFEQRVEQALNGIAKKDATENPEVQETKTNDEVFHLKEDSFWKMDSIVLLFEEVAKIISSDEVFYRARIHKRNEDYRDNYQNEAYESNEMNPPPADKVSEGRINRAYEPVLYLGSNPETAISEVRPWKHCAVAVSEFILKKDIKIVDFSREIRIRSPFFKEDLCWMQNISELINQLHLDFSTPVQPWDKGYLPTQLISSLVKEAGFDGIKYKSAMGEGYNLATFKWDYYEISDPLYYDVKSMTYDVRSRSANFGPVYSDGYYENI